MTAAPPPRTCCGSTTTPNKVCARAGARGSQSVSRSVRQTDAPQVGRPPPTSRDDGARADEGLDVVMREGGG